MTLRPPTVLAPKHNPHPTADRSAREKRDVLIQCEDCGAIATGRLIGRRITSGVFGDDARFHDCGGRLVAYDSRWR